MPMGSSLLGLQTLDLPLAINMSKQTIQHTCLEERGAIISLKKFLIKVLAKSKHGFFLLQTKIKRRPVKCNSVHLLTLLVCPGK